MNIRNYIVTMALALPLLGNAQNNAWEKPQAEMPTEKPQAVKDREAAKADADAKYLRGAVPEVDGKVVWTLDLNVPGKTAQEIYDITYKYLDDLTKGQNQLEGSAITLVNKQDHIIVANVREWMVFQNTFISLDRTRFHYTLIATCADGHLNLTMDRIAYKYEEERNPEIYTAEEWITDDVAVNKKNTKLYKGSAKFRRKTIDRKDQIFESIKRALKQK